MAFKFSPKYLHLNPPLLQTRAGLLSLIVNFLAIKLKAGDSKKNRSDQDSSDRAAFPIRAIVQMIFLYLCEIFPEFEVDSIKCCQVCCTWKIDSEETKNDSFKQLSGSGGFLGKVGVSIFSWLKIISY